jgi:hypothetical protein
MKSSASQCGGISRIGHKVNEIISESLIYSNPIGIELKYCSSWRSNIEFADEIDWAVQAWNFSGE